MNARMLNSALCVYSCSIRAMVIVKFEKRCLFKDAHFSLDTWEQTCCY